MNELVSIIIPVYNVGNYIENSIKSALEQTYDSIEYIVVNDCSSDDSINKLHQLLLKYPSKKDQFRLINLERNEGLSNARNVGMIEAKGRYIFFMDSDDCITKDCIENHIKVIEKYNLDFTDANVNISGTAHNMFNLYEQLNIIRGENVLSSYFNSLHVCGWNKLVRRNFIINNNIFFKKGMLYEDMLWCYQLCKKSKTYAQIPSVSYLYLLRSGSITTQNNNPSHARKQFGSFVELFKLMIDEFSNTHDNELKKMQNLWIGKKLLIVKSRLLLAPLNQNEKVKYFNKLQLYNSNTSGLFKVINKLNYFGFTLIFYLPNYIFRFLRKWL